MAVPFDHISFAYNPLFSEHFIEQVQRRYVWKYLEKIAPELNGLDILELNCGSGEDALLFGEAGSNIVATDITEEVCRLTQAKTKQLTMQTRVRSHYIDPESFDETVFDKKFNLIFVNFGCLNSMHPDRLTAFFEKVPSLLSANGRLIAVTIPKLRWRQVYHFLLRFNFIRAWQKFHEKNTRIVNKGIEKWLHTPHQLRQWSKEKFRLVCMKRVSYKYSPSDTDYNFLIDLQLK